MPKINLVKSNQHDSSKYDLDRVHLDDVKIGYVGHPNRIDHTHFIFITTDDRFKSFEEQKYATKSELCNMIYDFCCANNIEK